MRKILAILLVTSTYVNAQFYQIDYEVQPQIAFTPKAIEAMKQYYPDAKQREEMIEMTKNIPVMDYIFTYNSSQSQSTINLKLNNSQEQGGMQMGIGPDIGEKPIFNYKEQLYFNQSEFEGKKILVYDSLNKVDFKDTGKTKTILGIETKEAIGKHKDIDVIAWYAPSLPYAYSPDKYYGTKGLIMELHYKYIKDDIEVMISWNPKAKKELKKEPVYTINDNLRKVSYPELIIMYDEMNKRIMEEQNKGVDKK